MSWDVDLSQDGTICRVSAHEEGGTYALGGLPEASLNITYNYSRFYYEALDKEQGLSWLNGKKAKETIGRLADAVGTLGTKQYSDYWAPTHGNAGHALNILLQWAKQYPEATFRVS